jgi:Zn-finger nucleic acid-binding protein
MVQVYYSGVEVDRCTLCKGIFFDDLEKERLQEIKGAEVIDIGHPSVGARFNRPNRINCPRCGSRMVRMADLGQPHIWFEQCTACGGSFLDAGEFHDLKHHDIVDLFKDMAIRRKLRSRPEVIQEGKKQ